MKKEVRALALSCALLLALTACGDGEGQPAGESNPGTSTSGSSQTADSTGTSVGASSSSIGAEDAVRSCLAAYYGDDEITDISVGESKIDVQIQPLDTSAGASMQDTALQACESITSSVPECNVVIYVMDADENILLTVIDGKVTYSAFDDNSAAGTNAPTITLEEFEAIQNGMTYQEVTDIVGSSGELISEVDIGVADYYTQVRSWEGEGTLGANANVTFQGGKVTAKAQFGLE